MLAPTFKPVGISAIGVYEPPWVLGNEWFDGVLSRKFVQHTGIQSRRISLEDEVTMGVRAVDSLQREVNYDPRDCAAVVFASPSFVPVDVARKHLEPQQIPAERTALAAQQLACRLGISTERIVGLNWYCSGYSKAMAIVHRHILPGMILRQNQFLLVVTVSRISRITDYACRQTAPLFGDMATATLLAGTDSKKYPVHFTLLSADAETYPTERVLFDFHLRENVLTPTPDGGRGLVPRRLVYSLDGMGIGDAAPRCMADSLAKMLKVTDLPPEDVRFVVPHQAGTGIVRLAAMKLEEIGLHSEVFNGFNGEIGNVSSCSIPYALKKAWTRLHGTIACPTAGVGPPGVPKVTRGCILLRSTAIHERSLGRLDAA